MGWDTANPNSLQNKISDLSNKLKDIKTQIQKLEHAVMFGKEVKSIEYLIDQYDNHVMEGNFQDKLKLANLALSFGSDGFQRSLYSLEEMIEGTSQMFAEGSIFKIIANTKSNEESNTVIHATRC